MPARTRTQRETSAGGIVFRCTDSGPVVLLIHDSYKNWGFPKGHIDGDEAPEDTARREVREETGLADLVLHEALGTIDWFFRFRGQRIHKYCHYFLFESPGDVASPQQDEGIGAVQWYTLDEALATISYDNARGLLEQATEVVPRLCEHGEGSKET